MVLGLKVAKPYCRGRETQAFPTGSMLEPRRHEDRGKSRRLALPSDSQVVAVYQGPTLPSGRQLQGRMHLKITWEILSKADSESEAAPGFWERFHVTLMCSRGQEPCVRPWCPEMSTVLRGERARTKGRKSRDKKLFCCKISSTFFFLGRIFKSKASNYVSLCLIMIR